MNQSKVYVRFTRQANGWHIVCTDMWGQYELKQLHFADSIKIEEMAKRAGVLRDAAARQALEYGIQQGKGGFEMKLSERQFMALTVSKRR